MATDETALVCYLNDSGKDPSGLDEGRWDIPGLEFEHQGCRICIDVRLCAVLGTVDLVFPAEFSGVDLEGYGKRLHGWPPSAAPSGP